MLQYLGNHRASKQDHAVKKQSSRDQDERLFRRDLLKELDARETRHQAALEKTDARVAGLQATLDAVEQKYRALACDYTTLTERYAVQSQHIQNVTAIMLDRDHWRKQATTMADRVTHLESRIAHLEAEIERISQG